MTMPQSIPDGNTFTQRIFSQIAFFAQLPMRTHSQSLLACSCQFSDSFVRSVVSGTVRRRAARARIATVGPWHAIRRDQPVVLSRIYTRTGDDGTHRAGRREPGGQDRPAAGRLRRRGRGELRHRDGDHPGRAAREIAALLSRVQNELFDVGADLCNPVSDNPPYPPLRITEDYVDRAGAGLRRAQRGPAGAAQLHPARRHARAPRCCTRPGPSSAGRSAAPGPRWRPHGDTMNPLTAQLPEPAVRPAVHPGPGANGPDGDVLWKPGGER